MTETNKSGTLTMRVACAIFFLLFTFLYLLNYQADILAVAQHLLSHGVTRYNRVVGAVVITLVLWGIQVAVYAATGLTRRAHALTYLPSLLLLGILTDVSSLAATGRCATCWLWLFPLTMLVYACLVWVVRQLEHIELPALSTGLFSRMTWINLLQMVVMALVACGIGSSDEVFHYRMRAEQDILHGDYQAAATVGKGGEKTDSSLTMLRVWALSEQGRLGDRLFEYPLTGGSDAMLPNGGSVRLLMAPEARLYRDLGVVYREKMRPVKYLEQLHKKHYATPMAHEWLLCAYLLDRRLDDFAATLPHFHDINSPLPKSYREALVLYTHLREHPRIVYHAAVTDADYEDFRKLARSARNATERHALLKDSFGKTYWLYYYMGTSKKDAFSGNILSK